MKIKIRIVDLILYFSKLNSMIMKRNEMNNYQTSNLERPTQNCRDLIMNVSIHNSILSEMTPMLESLFSKNIYELSSKIKCYAKDFNYTKQLTLEARKITK